MAAGFEVGPGAAAASATPTPKFSADQLAATRTDPLRMTTSRCGLILRAFVIDGTPINPAFAAHDEYAPLLHQSSR
jgi:hypothetical protein